MSQHLVPSSALQAQFESPLSDISPQLNSLLLSQNTLIDALSLSRKQYKFHKQHLYVQAEADIEPIKIIEAYFSTEENSRELMSLVQEKSPPNTVYSWKPIEQTSDDETITTEIDHIHYLNENLTKANLFGRYIEQEHHSEFIPGALFKHQVLVIPVSRLLRNQFIWRSFVQYLTQGYVQLNENHPPLPLNCLVILVGNYDDYSLLKLTDELFNQAFPLFAECDIEYRIQPDTIEHYHEWLASVAQECDVKLDPSAYPELMRFASILSEHQHKLSLSSLLMKQCIQQAELFSENNTISASEVKQSLKYKEKRHSHSQQESIDSIIEKFVHLDTAGQVVGQINGLTVIDMLHSSYGEPARITATVHYGDGEVADIERKSELAGNLHAKGMMILTSCLYRIFGKDEALHLNANIVFEQSYSEIDGDSASLAEYCALISAISEKPIFQSLAVTGAIDQFGRVQAIGGVNEKITGFYRICKHRGFAPNQGVIIPKSNTIQLNLSEEIQQSVKNGEFKIYHVEHIDEAITLLTGETVGEMDEDHIFPDETLYGIVQDRLSTMAGDLHETTLLEKFQNFFKF